MDVVGYRRLGRCLDRRRRPQIGDMRPQLVGRRGRLVRPLGRQRVITPLTPVGASDIIH